MPKGEMLVAKQRKKYSFQISATCCVKKRKIREDSEEAVNYLGVSFWTQEAQRQQRIEAAACHSGPFA